MKKQVFILFTLIITVTAYCQTDSTKSNRKNQLVENEQTDSSILDFYRQYSSFTNPGEYEYLYEKLPDSLPELCSLIKSQFIHPYTELPKYREQIPKERWNESLKYPTVKLVLEGLPLTVRAPHGSLLAETHRGAPTLPRRPAVWA